MKEWRISSKLLHQQKNAKRNSMAEALWSCLSLQHVSSWYHHHEFTVLLSELGLFNLREREREITNLADYFWCMLQLMIEREIQMNAETYVHNKKPRKMLQKLLQNSWSKWERLKSKLWSWRRNLFMHCHHRDGLWKLWKFATWNFWRPPLREILEIIIAVYDSVSRASNPSPNRWFFASLWIVIQSCRGHQWRYTVVPLR